jgi:hypothetical protein
MIAGRMHQRLILRMRPDSFINVYPSSATAGSFVFSDDLRSWSQPT